MGTVGSKIFVEYWVAAWTQNSFNFSEEKKEDFYMLGYGLFILGMLILGTIQSIVWAKYATNAGMKIFKDLVENVMKKPMSYFDTTPIGQILNLLGKDTDMVDFLIPTFSLSIFGNIFEFIGIFVVAFLTNFILIPFIIFIFLLLFLLVRSYLNLQRETKRLELLTTSPIISNVVEVFNGILVFRNYDKISYIRKLYQNNVNTKIRMSLHSRYAQVMMQFYTQVIISVLVAGVFFMVSLGIVFEWSFIPQDISLLSVTLNSVLMIPNFISFFLFRYAILIQHMGSTERIFYNVDPDIREGDFHMPKPILNSEFPSKGVIEIKNIKVRYRDNLPLVLKGVSFTIGSHEKIGIVGRTGSGKSSLLLTLTRMLNVENSKFFKQIQYDQKLGAYVDVDKKKIERPSSAVLNHEGYKKMQTIPSMNNISEFKTNEANKL